MKQIIAGCIIFLMGLTSILALPRANQWLVSPNLIYYRYASKRHVDNDFMPAITAGFHYNDRWGVQLTWAHISTKYTINDKRRVSGWMSFLDGAYYFYSESYFQPYLLAGAGVINLRPRLNDDPSLEMNFNVGAGLAYFFDANIGLHLDARDVYTPNGGKNDYLLNFGVDFLFGGSKSIA